MTKGTAEHGRCKKCKAINIITLISVLPGNLSKQVDV